MRNQSMSGGYSQQGYQARPPSNWGQPAPPIQQSGYGYVQPGAYTGPPQYIVNQPPYAGYPPQPTSGGYSTGWDQSTAPQNQQAAQGGGYDYYNQQAPPQQQQSHGAPAAPADGSSYGYTQAPTYSHGQGYSQDGYGSYSTGTAQSGYSQPQTTAGAGYDQQQGYNAAYGNASNQTPDVHASSHGTQGDPNQAPAAAPAPGQSYNAGGQPSPNANYPSAQAQPGYVGGYGAQPPSYGSYGTPPAQKPGTQPTYSQPGYAQTDSAAQRPPSSVYPASQPGYGALPYGAPPATQTGYGQQQAPQYNSAAYGGGYSQTAAYASDGGNARGTYDEPLPQSAPAAVAAKASPPS